MVAPFSKGKKIKFLARVFQAIRIEVNQELEALKAFLVQSLEALNQGGRIVIISYHSLEDRLVKNFFRSGDFSGEVKRDLYGHTDLPFTPITRKPIIPDDSSINQNPRARSARLRIAEKN